VKTRRMFLGVFLAMIVGCLGVFFGEEDPSRVRMTTWQAAEAFGRLREKGISVFTLGKAKASLVPSSCRYEWMIPSLLIRKTAAFHGLKVAGGKGDSPWVIYRPAPDELVSELKQGFSSPDAIKRAEAAWEAGYAGDPRLVPFLVRAAEDKEKDVRTEARKSLSRLGWDAVFAVVPAGLKEKVWNLVFSCRESEVMEFLSRVGRRNRDAALVFLKKAVKSEDRTIVLKAVAALGALGDGEAVSLLGRVMKEADEEILKWSKHVARKGKYLNEKQVKAYRTVTDYKTIRLAVVRALGRTRDGGAMEFLKKALVHPDKAVGYAAVAALGEHGTTEAARLLRKTVEEDKRRGVRVKALIALGRAGGKNAIPVIKGCLAGNDRYLRGAAVTALGRTGAREAVPLLKETWKSGEPRLRVKALYALADVGERNDVLPVAMEAVKDSSPRIRRTGIKILGRVGGKEAVDALTGILKKKDASLRCAAVEALGCIGGRAAIKALSDALNDKQMSVRYSVVEVSERLSGMGVAELIERALKDREPTVRKEAVGDAEHGASSSEGIGGFGDRNTRPGGTFAREHRRAKRGVRAEESPRRQGRVGCPGGDRCAGEAGRRGCLGTCCGEIFFFRSSSEGGSGQGDR